MNKYIAVLLISILAFVMMLCFGCSPSLKRSINKSNRKVNRKFEKARKSVKRLERRINEKDDYELYLGALLKINYDRR